MRFLDSVSRFRSAAVAGSFILGISPVAPGAAPTRPGFAAPAEDAGAAGLFGALLDRLEQAVAGAGVAPAADPQSAPEPDAVAALGAALPAPPDAGDDTPSPLRPEAEARGTGALAELVDSLMPLVDALQAAVPQDGGAVDPALLAQVADAIDALAGLLDLALPYAAQRAAPAASAAPV
ncbi:MAG TPA: hypothetical protein VGD93_06910, partial [Devosia sp.]